MNKNFSYYTLIKLGDLLYVKKKSPKLFSGKAPKHSYYLVQLNSAKQKWTYVLNGINQWPDDYN